MALSERTYIERILVVLNADGTIRGAHQERIREILDDGAVLSVRSIPAEPVDGTALASALPQAALLAQISDLTTRLDEMMQRAKDAAELAAAAAPAQTAA